MATVRVEIVPVSPAAREPRADTQTAALLRDAGLDGLETVYPSRLFLIDGDLDAERAQRVAQSLLVDPVTEAAHVLVAGEVVPDPPAGRASFEVHLRPGVMDPVAESTLAELRAEGHAVTGVRTARRFVVAGRIEREALLAAARRTLANDCIEEVVLGTAGVREAPQPPVFEFKLRQVPIRELDDAGLERLSREGHLFLSLDEMRAIQAHFRQRGSEPTDLELETLAQTWSEHCVHKTLKSEVAYRGAGFGAADGGGTIERRYGNLLKETIAAATERLMAEGRGPRCLSVFKDNAGVIALDEQYGVAFKVETHNHPSAIEPYGGAATGVGGCIRDVIGCGRGARPIANTDVFCVAPGDWPLEDLPRGVLHPARVLKGVVQGVADYGNRMGIPTVNGAISFDPRYIGNPLVYCGCVGLIPIDKIDKAARPGDLVVLVGGRTGRDGIHGATFSSAELTDSHVDEFSHAVQIGNAITEKRVLDAVLRCRDDAAGCLYSAITDCGAGGLSSAVGEMGEAVGAAVELEKVPLKYAGLRYDEIWISEAQERMVLAVPAENIERLMRIMEQEECEATVIGTFGHAAGGRPELLVRYQGSVVGRLDMHFLHHGLPRQMRAAEWSTAEAFDSTVKAGERQAERPAPPGQLPADVPAPRDALAALLRVLASPDVCSREWVIRRYDHEVQGGSVVKPLGGPGGGPNDAAVLRPRLDSVRGVAVGCGLAPQVGDADPYWMALAAMDEAIRNVVSVGGDPRQTAVLDNFCWGRTDDPRQLGGLVRACQGCHDGALAYGVPFISGKDSLNNEFALDDGDVERLAATVQRYAAGDALRGAALRAAAEQIRRTRRVRIPATLLISALSLVDDVRRCVTADLKPGGGVLALVGGYRQVGFDARQAANVHAAVADAIRAGLVRACHDVGDGGWLAAVGEMAIGGLRGAELAPEEDRPPHPFEPQVAAYVMQVTDERRAEAHFGQRGVAWRWLGAVIAEPELRWGAAAVAVEKLRAAWAGKWAV